MDVEHRPASTRVRVGVCGVCTDAMYLVREEGGIRVECICGAHDIPAEFFELARSTDNPACTCVSLEEVNPTCRIHSR